MARAKGLVMALLSLALLLLSSFFIVGRECYYHEYYFEFLFLFIFFCFARVHC